VRRTAALAVGAALLAVGCGGGGSSPTATATPPASAGGDAAKVVVLDSGNFDALVLATPRSSLVEFHSPT
jgi:hypothetical protein